MSLEGQVLYCVFNTCVRIMSCSRGDSYRSGRLYLVNEKKEYNVTHVSGI